jgi:hypothetical protein
LDERQARLFKENKMAKKLVANLIALGGLAMSVAAGAATYTWTGGPGSLGAGGTGGTSDALRDSQSMTFTYNEQTQYLSVSAKWFNTSADGAPEGAWLVLSDGAMPKASPGEVPIYYIDWANGVNRISSAVYDGSVSDGGGYSFGSVDNQIWFGGCQVRTASCTSDFRSINFTLDLARINAYDPNGSAPGQGDWKGGDFANNVGVWFHWFDQNATTKTTYAAAPGGGFKVTNVGTLNQSYYDTGACGNRTHISGTPTGGQAGNDVGGVNCNAYGPNGNSGGNGVPTPGIALLLGLGLISLRRFTKRA